MLSKCILASFGAGRRLLWHEILQRVMFRLRRWSAGDLASLWSEALTDGRSISRRGASPTTSDFQHHINARIAELAVQNGQYNKAIQALTSEGVASPSPEVLQKMLNKHPQAPPPALPSGQVPSPAKITEAAVCQGVRSFPNGYAPGPTGLHPTHLREAVGCPSPDRSSQVLTSLTMFVNLFGIWQSSTRHPPPSLWGHPSRHPEKEWRSPAHRRRGSSAAADVQVPLLHLPFHSPTRPGSLRARCRRQRWL